MSDPGRRYRRWLRLYPEPYRTARGEEILSTLLDSAGGGGPAWRDLLTLVLHAARVRIGLILRRPGRPPLPQPVRLVTWLLVGSAAAAWANAVFDRGYPMHRGPGPGPIVAGFIFLGLNFLLQARRRWLFMLVIGVFGLFTASILVDTRSIVAGLVLASPYVLCALLLIAGRKRYMRAISASA
ncbi:MAG TPA: hypothetical protein VN799_10430 [Acidimicrobiales bacterium]|nr:hypothetical protein [Acidimicrobiales bacterium]